MNWGNCCPDVESVLNSVVLTQSPKRASLPPMPTITMSAPFTALICGGCSNGVPGLVVWYRLSRVAPETGTNDTWMSAPGLAAWSRLSAWRVGAVDDWCAGSIWRLSYVMPSSVVTGTGTRRYVDEVAPSPLVNESPTTTTFSVVLGATVVGAADR